MESEKIIYLDGNTLKEQDLFNIGYHGYKVAITQEVEALIQKGRDVIEDILKSEKTVYGINTGFGLFSDVIIPPDQVKVLQCNLIRSHSSGVGKPLSPERTRMLLALRINVLTKGNSGITLETVKRAINFLNANCLPFVPEQGTVGASGDLAPLSHLALGMMGEGKMYDFGETNNQFHSKIDINCLDSGNYKFSPSEEILKRHNLPAIELNAKEGLALINGTQLITSLGIEALHRCKILAQTANIITAITFEALKGLTAAYNPLIHAARPHTGQNEVAAFLRSILHSERFPSEITTIGNKDTKKVQDSYTLRCVPQVHGIVFDTIKFAEDILTTEMNSATDNPMVFNTEEFVGTISGGNFHGEYPAKALDYLAIGIHELSNISERRMERLVNSQLSEGLPSFLVNGGGLNSGYMISHCTAAALVSENKVLVHPSSADTLSTSSAKEDHVSMGGWAARKCLLVVENVENVLAIELLAACQAIDFRRPLKTTEPLEAVHKLVRSKVSFMEKDRYLSPDIEEVYKLIRTGQILNAVNEVLNRN
ncbi:histidase [Dictyostelium purpureum]|uniref:Histidine ammonia-lyase n=1 Tax=Dictyostelium purpureum TaxID=5786 RepID=F0ZLW5_DICPU|nr:histidase [Dictyostelium purpureum]EGC35057.1 histidase [Dictyostelium purpureum]|eukprot:XP_003288425.1 histidase [Dictyostelium purpureum]